MASRFVLISVILGVLAVTASAVPTLTVTKGGTYANNFLDANGNWVFKVQITPSAADVRLGMELGFRAGTGLRSVTSNIAEFPTPTPGMQIFNWEVFTDVDGGNMQPVGLQANCQACRINGLTTNVVPGNLDEIFSSLASIDFGSLATHDYLTITVRGPSTQGNLYSTLQWLGKYGTPTANQGRISETPVGGGTTTNFDTFAGSVTFIAKPGDINLDGQRNGLDVGPFLLGYQAGVGKWFNGDSTGDGLVNGFDSRDFLCGDLCLGSGTSEALSDVHAPTFSRQTVPEPATGWLVLVALGALSMRRTSC